MRIAVDNQVPQKTIEAFMNRGYRIVIAATNEHDEYWLKKAWDYKADIYISPDSDVENFALNRGKSYIKMPQNLKAGALTDFLLRRIHAAIKIKKLYQDYPELIVGRER